MFQSGVAIVVMTTGLHVPVDCSNYSNDNRLPYTGQVISGSHDIMLMLVLYKFVFMTTNLNYSGITIVVMTIC